MRAFLKVLGLQTSSVEAPALTPLYLVSSTEQATHDLVNSVQQLFQVSGSEQFSDALDIFAFVTSSEPVPSNNAVKLIIPLSSQASVPKTLFSLPDFLSQLQTVKMARSILYGEVVSSTQTILDK